MRAYGRIKSNLRVRTCKDKNCTTCRPKVIKKASERRKNNVLKYPSSY